MRTKLTTIQGVLLLLMLVSPRASAAPILGGQLFYTGGVITITTLPVTSAFASQLGLYNAEFTRLRFLTNDEPANFTVTFDPGAEFGIGVNEELIFGIRVVSDLDRQYFSGPATRNPDNVVHNVIDGPKELVPFMTTGFEVGFEDQFGGGDRDYDDNRFFFTGAITPKPVPEPVTIVLLGFGLGTLHFLRRRRK